MATAALENSENIDVEQTDRGAVVTTEDEAPYGGVFDGLQEEEKEATPEETEDKTEEAVEETPAEETVEPAEETAQTVEETPVEEKAEEKPAGISISMRQVALQGGLPEFLIDNLYDDAQVQVFMDANRAMNNAQAEGEQDDELTAKLMIPDEDFDANDPIHAQQKHLVEVFNKAMKQMREGVNESLTSSRTVKAEREQDSKNGMFLAYDQALDTLDQDIIGKSGSDQRKQTWPLFSALLAANPEKDYTQLAIQAARATHDKLVTTSAVKAQQENLDEQKTKKLGGGSSPPPIETPIGSSDEFCAWLRALPTDN